MPKGISPMEYSRRLMKAKTLIQPKITELILQDKNQPLRNAKRNEFEFGLRPDYTKIGVYSNENYAHRKYLLNPLAGSGNVDLYLTGATDRSLFVRQGGAGFVFDAQTNQWGYNKTKYGNDIQGLNQRKFIQIEIQNFLPKLLKYIKLNAKIA